MSFASKAKNELCKPEKERDCCSKAELAGVIAFAGIINLSGRKRFLKINTENASVARRIFNLIKWVFNIHTKVIIKKNRSQRFSGSFALVIEDWEALSTLLKGIKLINKTKENGMVTNFRNSDSITHTECCKKAYIRGAFLGGGSITDPEKNYHFEIVTHHFLLSKDLCGLINSFGLDAKIVVRKSNYVVYFKGSDNIVDILNIIGAHKSLMELENIRIFKEVRNNVNRVVNCETANLEKTVNAAVKQIQSIELIAKHIGIENLPDNLKEIARMRLEYKESTLKELGEMMHPPIGKSGVNHRLRKLQEIAERIIK